MKILYHHRTQGRGAEGVHIREVALALEKLGNKIIVISPQGIDPFAQETESQTVTSKKTVWSFISRHIPQIGFEILELCYNFSAYRKIKRVLIKEDIDFIYERYAFFGWLGTHLAKRFGVPIILEVNEISGIKRQRGQILKGLAQSIERWIFQRASAIVTVSEFLKQHIVARAGQQQKVFVIPNAVNEEEFNPEIVGKNKHPQYRFNGKTVIGFVGCFSVWDRLDFLIEVFSEIFPTHNTLHLLLVGDGTDRKALEKKARLTGTRNNITFTGKVNRKDIPYFINLMDICVLSHSNPFGSPIVLFEYMAMAKPVVAPRIGPIAQIINDGDNGILFELEDKEVFKEKLFDLLDNKEKTKKLGLAARDSILSGHLWKHNAEKIIRIYNEVKHT